MLAKLSGLGSLWVGGLLLFVGTSVFASGDLRLVEAIRNRDTKAVPALLEQHVDVNRRQADGASALHWAAHWDELETADLLIRAGANVNATNDYDVTPLSLAATNGSVAMVEKLLKAGANANAVLLTGETVLMTAARTGKVDVVKMLLLHGADANAKQTSKGQTALMWAVSEKHLEVARTLIEHGADVKARSNGGVVAQASPQILRDNAVKAQDKPDQIAGADRDGRASNGFTPLLFAAREGTLEAARLLLAHGADPNETSADGSTPLLVATVRGHPALARFFLDQGANPEGNAEEAGYTPLHWASGRFETETFVEYSVESGEWSALVGMPTREGKLELIRALLAHGANPNARLTKDPPRYGYTLFRRNYLPGATPFYLAALATDVEVMRLLQANGADPVATAKDGTTPLMSAAGIAKLEETHVPESDYLEAVKLALEFGNDIDATNNEGFSAMHAAALAGHDTVVQLLADQGAKLSGLSKNGETPLSIAEGFGRRAVFIERPSTAALLRKLGAVSNGR